MAIKVQRSLAAGEISPALYQRTDIDKFRLAMRVVRNFWIKKGGGAQNRGGSTYVYGAADPDQDPRPDFGVTPIGPGTRLFGWKSPSSEDSYVIEFGDGFLRFAKNGEQVTVGVTDNWDTDPFIVGDLATIAGVHYYCTFPHSNKQPGVAVDWTDYWWELEGYEYSIPTPYYSTNDIFVRDCCFAQDSSFLLITHPNVLPQILVREGDTQWMLYEWVTRSDVFATYGLPRIAPPTNPQHSGGTGADEFWAIAAVTEDLEESLPLLIDGAAGTSGTPAVLQWTESVFEPQSQARPPTTGSIKGYNVYKRFAGVYFYIAFTAETTYSDNGSIIPDTDGDSPPERRVELLHSGTGDYPARCGTFGQRTLLGRFPFNVQAGYASRIGQPENFTRRFPAADDDSILFQLKGQEVSGIRHFVDIGDLLVLADSGEWIIKGSGANEAFVPKPAPAPKRISGYGAKGDVTPVVVGDRAVYVQEVGSIVRSVGYDATKGGKDGYINEDLLAFAEHLVDGKEILSVAFQKTPHSIVWCVLDDGTMIGLTYIKEQDIMAWHRHDTDGEFEEVCCIPEGNEDALYFVVKREIDGEEIRYLERMTNRSQADVRDLCLMDCALTFDGRNTGDDTMTLSGGAAWDDSELLTLTSSVDKWDQDEIGNEFHLTGDDGEIYRFKVVTVTDLRICRVSTTKVVPVAAGLRDTATTNWARAVDELSGLEHLEGKEVSIFADGYVVASPYEPEYDTVTVTAGVVALGGCYAVAHVGLPFLSDLETLDIDTAGGEQIEGKLVTAVKLNLEKTRGVWAGAAAPSDDDEDPLENLNPMKPSEEEDNELPPELRTGEEEIGLQGEWNSNGRVFIRQAGPLPVTVLGIKPCGLFAEAGGK